MLLAFVAGVLAFDADVVASVDKGLCLLQGVAALVHASFIKDAIL